ncbi:hypothetical protein H4R33_000397 [Dimargaris cristalligena]|nr:hypothetical protein H4R33_000397 [Dimargaris cristalligena]
MEMDESNLKRQRVSRACDACRKKKVKCDGVSPICTNCQLLENVCTYKDTAKKRGPPKGYIDAIESKLTRMENLLAELVDGEGQVQPQVLTELRTLRLDNPIIKNKKTGHPHTAAEGRAQRLEPRKHPITDSGSPEFESRGTASPHGPYERETVLRSNVAMNHLAVDEFGNQRYCGQSSGMWLLRESTKFQRGILVGKRATLLNSPRKCPYTDVSQVPREVELALIRGFFEHIYPIFPIVLPRQFWNAYHDPADPISLLLKYSMFACVSKFVDLDDILHGTNDLLAILYFDTLRPYLMHNLFTSSITMVQSLILLCIYQHGCLTMKGWKYNGMAINLAYDLGLHRDPERMGLARMSEQDCELRRRIWWSCYTLDTIGSASLGRPPVVKSMGFDTEFCKLDEDAEFVAAIIDQRIVGPVTDSTIIPPADRRRQELPFSISRHSKYLLTLVHLANRTMNQVYGYQSVFLKDDHHPIIFNIPVAQLDKQLRSWLINLPPELKYSPSDYLKLQPAPHRFITMMHSIYHHTLILIHRPFLAHQWHIPILAVEPTPPFDMAGPSTAGRGGDSGNGGALGDLDGRGMLDPSSSTGNGLDVHGRQFSTTLSSAEFSSLQICTSSSAALTCIQYLASHKSRNFGSIFSISMVMSSATLHLHNALSPEPTYARAAKSYLRTSLETLATLGQRWSSARNLVAVLEELIDIRHISLTGIPHSVDLDPDENLAYALAVNPMQIMDDVLASPPHTMTTTGQSTNERGFALGGGSSNSSSGPFVPSLIKGHPSNGQGPQSKHSLHLLSQTATSEGGTPSSGSQSNRKNSPGPGQSRRSAKDRSNSLSTGPYPPRPRPMPAGRNLLQARPGATRNLTLNFPPHYQSPEVAARHVSSASLGHVASTSGAIKGEMDGRPSLTTPIGPGMAGGPMVPQTVGYALVRLDPATGQRQVGSGTQMNPPHYIPNVGITTQLSPGQPPNMRSLYPTQMLWTNMMDDPNFDVGVRSADNQAHNRLEVVSSMALDNQKGAAGGGGGNTLPYDMAPNNHPSMGLSMDGSRLGGGPSITNSPAFSTPVLSTTANRGSPHPGNSQPSGSAVGGGGGGRFSSGASNSGTPPLDPQQTHPLTVDFKPASFPAAYPTPLHSFDPYAVYGAATGNDIHHIQSFLRQPGRLSTMAGNMSSPTVTPPTPVNGATATHSPGLNIYQNSAGPVSGPSAGMLLQAGNGGGIAASGQTETAASANGLSGLPTMGVATELTIDYDEPDPVSVIQGNHPSAPHYPNSGPGSRPTHPHHHHQHHSNHPLSGPIRQAPLIIPAQQNYPQPGGSANPNNHPSMTSRSFSLGNIGGGNNGGVMASNSAILSAGGDQGGGGGGLMLTGTSRGGPPPPPTQQQQAPFIPTRGQNQAFFTNLDNFFFDTESMDLNGWELGGQSPSSSQL